jgi:hypothetical protein
MANAQVRGKAVSIINGITETGHKTGARMARTPGGPIGRLRPVQYIATGLPGDPVPPLILSGDQANRNS